MLATSAHIVLKKNFSKEITSLEDLFVIINRCQIDSNVKDVKYLLSLNNFSFLFLFLYIYFFNNC